MIIIASINADIFQNYDIMTNIINGVGNNHIDISCAQEAHSDRNGSVRISNYAIWCGGNGAEINEQEIYANYDNRKSGSVAIAIKNDLLEHISKIIRIDGRTMG